MKPAHPPASHVLIAVLCLLSLGYPTEAGAWSMDTPVRDADASFLGEGDDAGFDVANAGDLDGDGLDDILIGAPFNSQTAEDAGKLHVFFGRAAGWSLDTPLDQADASFLGIVEDGNLGMDVEIVGDVDGDGLDDFLACASGAANHRGIVYLVLGRTGGWAADADIDTADGWFVGEDSSGMPSALTGLGDVDGDGIDDFLIGAVNSGEAAPSAGQVYLFLGRESVWAPASSLADADASFLGEFEDDHASALDGRGDVNGDGLNDILIGAVGSDAAESEAGQSYLVFGRAAGWSMDTSLAAADTSFLGQADGDTSGQAGCLADADGDGFADILIGAKGHENGDGDEGRAYLVAGEASGWQMDQSLDTADARVDAEAPGDWFGWPISCVGDVNGDGFEDALISAIMNGENGPESGQSYLFLGSSSVLDGPLEPAASFLGSEEGDRAGVALTGGGDVDGDGFADILIRSSRHSEDGEHLGTQLYLFLGWDGCDDLDGDGYDGCNQDCNDGDPAVHPDAVEVCDDHFDNDCDGLIDGFDPACDEVGEEPEPSDCRCVSVPAAGPPGAAAVACLVWIGWVVRRFRSG